MNYDTAISSSGIISSYTYDNNPTPYQPLSPALKWYYGPTDNNITILERGAFTYVYQFVYDTEGRPLERLKTGVPLPPGEHGLVRYRYECP